MRLGQLEECNALRFLYARPFILCLLRHPSLSSKPVSTFGVLEQSPWSWRKKKRRKERRKKKYRRRKRRRKMKRMRRFP